MCTLVQFTEDSSYMRKIPFSPNGEYLASSTQGTINVWKVSSGEQIKTLTKHSFIVTSVVFSPNREHLDQDYRCGYRERTETLTGHSRGALSIMFSPNGEYLAFGSMENTIWRVSSGEKTLLSFC